MPVDFFDRHAVAVAAAIAGFVAFELACIGLGRGSPVPAGSAASNVACHLVGTAIRFATRSVRVGAFVAVGSVAPIELPATPITGVFAYLAIDLTLYGWHRLLHEVPALWAFHSVHHSSEHFDLSLGGRASWFQRAFDDLIYLPVVWAGVPVPLAITLIDVNRLSQFWTHSSTLGRLTWLDGWLDTPSNHRVHHRRSGPGPAKNYGSTFVIWDRIFGTYELELEHEAYGTSLGDVSDHPIRIQFAGLRWIFARYGLREALRRRRSLESAGAVVP